ncbi:MAG: DUF1566 domain-containing protein [Sulfurovum sp.]
MRLIFLIVIGISSLCYGDFSRDRGVVTDNLTKLQWQDEYGDNNQSAKYTTWNDSLKFCKTLYLNGRGWRLPTRAELIDIIDYGKIDPSIDTIFQQTVGFFYWSITSQAKFKSNAWRISFNSGYSNYSSKLGKSNVRCVREQK